MLPLADSELVVHGRWPAAVQAGRLLRGLGARSEAGPADAVALSSGDVSVTAGPTTAEQDWADSGARSLTGRVGGPRLSPAGAPASLARGAGLAWELLTAADGRPLPVDGASVLGQRAASGGLRGGGVVSAGGSTRLLQAADGWWALNLARAADVELVPALVGHPVGADAWESVESWSRVQRRREVAARAVELGLAFGIPGSRPSPPQPWNIAVEAGPAHRSQARPLVVNLGALWAGPLCASLLRQAGAAVADVESDTRPDSVRHHDLAFYQALHAGNELVRLDFRSDSGRRALRDLLMSADVVIEASRPRALRQLGVAREQLPAGGPRVWVQITGHGAEQPNRIGFGDDAAVEGGLIAVDERGPVFAGDAIADPLTGLVAGLAAYACLRQPGRAVVQVSLSGVAAYAAGVPECARC